MTILTHPCSFCPNDAIDMTAHAQNDNFGQCTKCECSVEVSLHDRLEAYRKA